MGTVFIWSYSKSLKFSRNTSFCYKYYYLNLQVLNKKDVKGDMDDDAEDYTLTPGTEARYRQIDQEYTKVMQQTPQTELVGIFEFIPI